MVPGIGRASDSRNQDADTFCENEIRIIMKNHKNAKIGGAIGVKSYMLTKVFLSAMVEHGPFPPHPIPRRSLPRHLPRQ